MASHRPPHAIRAGVIGCGIIVTLLSASLARAEIMETTRPLKAGNITLGVEFEAGLQSPAPLMLNFHEAIGLAGRFDLALREGIALRTRDFYLGAAIKWTILLDSKDSPGLALWGGGHFLTSGSVGGVDATFMIDHTFDRFTPYLAADFNLDFSDTVDAKFGFIGGCKVSLHRFVALFVEGGLGLTGAPKPHFVSAGIKVYF
jgi:hypothetical protein